MLREGNHQWNKKEKKENSVKINGRRYLQMIQPIRHLIDMYWMNNQRLNWAMLNENKYYIEPTSF